VESNENFLALLIICGEVKREKAVLVGNSFIELELFFFTG
jgi:hypothetical protein